MTKKLFFLGVAFAGLSLSNAACCPNGCSGHGTCGADAVCTCYNGWELADCSERTCPFDIAWVDAPRTDNQAHGLAECSNRGLCDRSTGECECFAGYDGSACQRTECPNDCSGHGTCEYLEEIQGNIYDSASTDQWQAIAHGTFDQRKVSSVAADSAGRRWPHSHSAAGPVSSSVGALWDRRKTRGCVCDPMYEGADCSMKSCPVGNDVISVSSATNWQTQRVEMTGQNIGEGQFGLIFYDQYNGRWFSDELWNGMAMHMAPASADDILADNMEAALERLPLQAVEVDVVASIRDNSGNASDTTIFYDITFGSSTEGSQNTGNLKLLGINWDDCSTAGCQPMRSTFVGHDKEDSGVKQLTAADYGSYECGRRGRCDHDSGVCECFDGFYLDDCSAQTALV